MEYIKPEKVKSTIVSRILLIISIPLLIYGFFKLGLFLGLLLSRLLFPYLPMWLWWGLWLNGVPFYILWGIGAIIINIIAYIATGHHAGYYCIDGGQHDHDGFSAGDCGLSSFDHSWCKKCGKSHY